MSLLRRTPSGAAFLCALTALLALTACEDGPPGQPTAPVAPQAVKPPPSGGTVTVTVTLAGGGNHAAQYITVGLVGAGGPVAQDSTDANGVVTFPDIAAGTYCIWASPVALSAFKGGGDYIVPPGNFASIGNGLNNQGAVLTASTKQDVVSNATYKANCRADTRPVTVNGNTSVKLQFVAYPSSTLTLLGFDGNAVSNTTAAYLVAPFDTSWRSLPDLDVEGVKPGFLIGANLGASGLRTLPAPAFLYNIEILTLGPAGIPSARGLTGTGPQAFGVVYMEPLSCRVDRITDATGDATNPDIQDTIYYGFGASPGGIHAVPDRFGVWWEQQQQTPTVSMEYSSRTTADGFATLQLTADFGVEKNGTSCSIQNLTVSGSATTSASMTANVYCLVSVYTGRVRVTVVERGLPTGFTGHTFSIGTPGNPGAAEKVPDTSRNDANSAYVDTAPVPEECGATANDPKFDILN